MKSLGVFCGSSRGHSPAFSTAAQTLGQTLAARGIELVYGGSHVGLMGVVANAVLAGGGKVTGVLPRFMADRELAHPGLTKLFLVDSMHERKQLMAELAEGFVALPGGFGTFEEIFEAITWGQLHLHACPCAFFNVDHYFDALVGFMENAVASGFVRPEQFASLIVTSDVEDLFERLATFQPAKTEKWIPKRMI